MVGLHHLYVFASDKNVSYLLKDAKIKGIFISLLEYYLSTSTWW